MSLSNKDKEVILDAFLNQPENPVICLDPEATIVEFNEAAAKLFGMSKIFPLYKNFFVLCRRHYINNPIQTWPLLSITKARTELANDKLIEWTIIPLYQENIFSGCIILGNNQLNQHKNSNEATNTVTSYLDTVINNIPHFIFWKNANSVFLGCNQQFAEACGFRSVVDVIGKTDIDMPWGKEQGPEYMTDDKLVMDSQKPLLNYEEKQRQKDGAEKTMLVSKVPMYGDDHQVTGVFCIYTDITQRKQMENELQIAKERAEVANKAKSEFIAVASHELRIPLTGILGMINFLKDDNLSPAEKNEYISNLSKSSQHLLSLINDILDFSKLEADKFELTPAPLNLKTLVEEVISMLTASAKIKNLALLLNYPLTTPHHLIGDARVIRQILTNLVGNAIKFTEKGFVRVTVQSKQKTSSEVEIVLLVEDTGIGIPADKQEIIFEHFQQISPVYTRSSSQAGTGLGLAITKKMVEFMNGEIKVISELNRGSTFYCTFPFNLQQPCHLDDNKNSDGKEDNSYILPRHSESIRVLLVEDDAIVQLIHKKYIQQLGCELTVAETAKQALLHAAEQPDLILMDVGIPEMSGLEITSIIREQEKNSLHRICIIGLTGYSDKESHEKCLAAGMDGVLIKPVQAEEISKIVDQVRTNAMKEKT